MYTTPVAASANWFAARICCSFGSTRDVFPNDLVFPNYSCVVRVHCALWGTCCASLPRIL